MLLPSASEDPIGLRTAIASIVCTILAGIFVILRIINRVFVLKNFAVDDWLICIAWPLSIVFTVLDCLGMSEPTAGLGTIY